MLACALEMTALVFGTEGVSEKLDQTLKEVQVTQQEQKDLLAAVQAVADAQAAEAAAVATVQGDMTGVVTLLQNANVADPAIDQAIQALSASASALGTSATNLNASAASLSPFLPAPPAPAPAPTAPTP